MANYRKIWEDQNGKIPKGWHIHHLDGDRSNDDIENLIAVIPQLHYEIHKVLGERYNSHKDKSAAGYLKNYLNGEPPQASIKKRTGVHGNKGKIKSAEWCKNISKSKTGVPNPALLGNAHRGTKVTDVKTGIKYKSKREMARNISLCRRSLEFEKRCNYGQ